MKNIYDCIKESLLDDEDEIISNIDNTYFVRSAYHAKTLSKFNIEIQKLIQYLNEEYGADYEGSLQKGKNNRKDIFIAIIEHASKTDTHYNFFLTFGGSKSYIMSYWVHASSVHIWAYNYSLNTYAKVMNKRDNLHVWKLDESWRKLQEFFDDKSE